MSKRYIQKARKERLAELKHLFTEAKSFSTLQENKKLPSFQKKARYFISEYRRISGAYAALLMLEFYEKGTKETLGVLKVIQRNNADNELGVFLSDLKMDKLVQAMDAITSQETTATTAAGGFKAGKNMAHAGYGSGGFSPTVGGGIRESLSEGKMINELFGFGSKKSTEEEPYEPTPSMVRVGQKTGTFTPAELTSKGQTAKQTQDRQQLMDEFQKEMPKVVAFIDAYLAVFKEENKSKLKAGKGLFGTSPVASLIKKEFGKVPGFNVGMFIRDIAEDADLVDTNIAMATNPSNFEALTSLEDTAKTVQARIKKSFGSHFADMFTSFGGSSQGFKTMFETSN